MRPASADWRVQRNATETREIAVPGIDLRGQDQLLQIRLDRDAPGVPQVSLSPAAAGTQGLSVSYAVVNGIGTSTIVAQIDRATIQALLPFGDNGLEPGAEVVLAYDHLIALPGDTLKPYYGGAFIIEPGVSVPWTTGNIPVLPGVPQAEDLGAAITRANTAGDNAQAGADRANTAANNAQTGADRANAAASSLSKQQVVTFLASGTLTLSNYPGAKTYRFILEGAGGGGGGGPKVAASVSCSGGAGGAGGCFRDVILDAAILPATLQVTVGAAGLGGQGATSVGDQPFVPFVPFSGAAGSIAEPSRVPTAVGRSLTRPSPSR